MLNIVELMFACAVSPRYSASALRKILDLWPSVDSRVLITIKTTKAQSRISFHWIVILQLIQWKDNIFLFLWTSALGFLADHTLLFSSWLKHLGVVLPWSQQSDHAFALGFTALDEEESDSHYRLRKHHVPDKQDSAELVQVIKSI